MALTQSARLAGPSWEDEVVPALRKRLEGESRTLARRMSAISLSSVDEPTPTTSYAYPEEPTRQNNIRSNTQPMGASTMETVYQQQHQPSYPDRTMPTAAKGQRSRTYSSPYGNGHANAAGRPKVVSSKSPDTSRSLSPRPTDVKPTRIPKASRPPGTSSSANSPHIGHVTPQLAYQQPKPQLAHSSSRASTVELTGAQSPVLLHESPPFPTHATMSSGFEEDPPRPSMESEERPFEHWYRGEVARNGGVGELRVGRRQEMLDIANYGHLIANKKRPVPMETAAEQVVVRHRQRAGSIAGLTNKERARESFYLDEEHANEVGQVLDEHPPTDLDEDGSVVSEDKDDNEVVAYAYIPGEQDDWIHNVRSTTPTPSNMLPRPSSRQQQQQQLPPSRIPGLASRRTSESRSSSTMSPQTQVGMSRYGDFGPSSSSTRETTPSPPSIQSSTSKQPNSSSISSTQKQPQKRGASPAASTPPKKAKPKPTPGRAATQAKIAGKKKEETNNDRASIAQYPTPDGDEDDMADAIPSWTQPVPREGNWDDVVLPVVAKKKGLDGYYQDANGSPQPRKTSNPVEPAPGTFGYDHSKYRPPRADGESIPMDEFGRSTKPVQEETEQDLDERPIHPQTSSPHDETKLPVPQPPSPEPFAQYAPTQTTMHVRGANDLEAQKMSQQQQHQRPQPRRQQQQQQQVEEEKDAGGCCKCVIM
ncbi:hypothetical protein D9613_005716 [Agrocybe pediades]|uniref:Uncharacterized protein n=1 Tax=Agrocybe pediades TaxID=84607 RepID=A0A8H4QVA6_9AGAR|nr:hypothetical protein D9613_005716 [Agrocybe pediades]